MRITFLGHAGFCVETEHAIVITDPWLSPNGAFDSAWFQYPRNHHLAALVQEKLADDSKARYVYISHEHKDHLDVDFMASLRCRDFTLVIPQFRRDYLETAFADYRCLDVVACADGGEVEIPGGSLKLYLDDSELNRDSAILVRAGDTRFLDLNDCRIFDALPMILREEGSIDVFACQFSGAGWHPTCYAYPRETYTAISEKKVRAKFLAVARALTTLKPRVYIASAGPPCFLDPRLLHLNFEPVNIFPRPPQLHAFLEQRVGSQGTSWPDMMPGDIVDAEAGSVVYRSPERVDESTHERYVRSYAALYEGFFEERRRRFEEQGQNGHLLESLRAALLDKLEGLTLHDRIETPLFFVLEDQPERFLRVDFPKKQVEYATVADDTNQYTIAAPSWEVARVLDGKITWDDFSLSFRMELNREPDVYHTVVQGFLRLETEDMNWFCAKLLNIENNQERIVVEAGGRRYAVNRYCPHQGGDLTRAWVEEDRFLTCPRHQWQFDLENEGAARRNEGCIHAVCLDDD
jgi:UDP-MurNAc hydroxylase